MTTATEQARALYAPGVPYEIPIPDKPLTSLLFEAAKKYPNAPALDFFGRVWSYSQLQMEVEKAAGALARAGVQRGTPVALILPNCPQHFVAFYAILRLGAVVVEHNPLAPAAEISGQFVRHRAEVVVAWEKSVPKVPVKENGQPRKIFAVDLSAAMPLKHRVLLSLPLPPAKAKREQIRGKVPSWVLSWDRNVAKADPISLNHPGADVNDTAVILHTGGTNGIPKSVPLTHKNVGANVNQCYFWVHKLHEGGETFYSLLPYFHSFGMTFFMCAAVRLAACQIVLPNFDVKMALEAHQRRPVTFFVGVPPMFDRIERGATKANISLKTIKWAISGAMELRADVVQRWEKATGGQIIPGYGLTETSPVVAGSPLEPGCRTDVLGVPFPSTQIRVVDPANPDKDVPAGTPGELVIKGPQVFSGYLDAPTETAEIFTSTGWMRTGDIVRQEGGYLVMADRRKELILSGGFNVYPSQVEKAISTMPGIREVAIVGIPRESELGEEVTAAVVVEDGANLTLESVRQWAEKTVAHYALPRQIVLVSELPRSQIGKLLRRKVREDILKLRQPK